jgi:DNA-binding HxlR family transcriptional regulator
VILRDMMFGNRRYFRELLHNSVEGIASNILANRLQRLVDNGLISRAKDPAHKQKIRYSLSEPAIQLVSIMAHLGAWGRRHLPVKRELAIRAELLSEGPSCGSGSWTSCASSTWASRDRQAPSQCSPNSKPPTRPNWLPAEPGLNAAQRRAGPAQLAHPLRHAHTTETTPEPNSRTTVPQGWFGEPSR